MSGVRKSDHPERRKLALMRRADTEAGATHNIGGVKRRTKGRPKPSLPKTPWDADPLPNPFMELAPNRYEGPCVDGPLAGQTLANDSDLRPLYRFRDGISEFQGYYHFDGGRWSWRSREDASARVKARTRRGTD